MTNKHAAIVWKNEIVGHMEEPKSDNFHLYGKWIPQGTPTSLRFLELLKEGEQLSVEIREGELIIPATIGDDIDEGFVDAVVRLG